MNKHLLILLILLIAFAGCKFSKLRESSIKKKEAQTEQTESARQETIKEKQRDTQKALNDTLVKSLLVKFPLALLTDSIDYTYTYYIKELLEKSSNILLFKRAYIKDVEAAKGYYLITVYSYFPQIVGQFKVYPQLSARLLKELNPKYDFGTVCLVVKVKGLTPIKTDIVLNFEEFYKTSESSLVSEDDMKNYVHLNLESGAIRFYIVNGELIDYYLLK